MRRKCIAWWEGNSEVNTEHDINERKEIKHAHLLSQSIFLIRIYKKKQGQENKCITKCYNIVEETTHMAIYGV
jgi:hypothetical protein